MKTNASAEVKRITPEIAVEWLAERWGEQRGVRVPHVSRLAADMEAGRFKISPDAILRIKGKLANGQHRLEAVVQCGKAQTFLVMESNDEELYKVIDAGLRRTVSDGLIGIHFAKAIPSIARWVQAYESRTIRPGARSGSEAGAEGSHVPTQCEQIDYCVANQELLSEAAAFVNPLYERTKLLPVSMGAAIYAIGAIHNNLERAKLFLNSVYVDGGNTSAGDLRNRLISNRGSKAKLHPGYVFGITIKAFKSYINGTRPGVLKWSNGEEFPRFEMNPFGHHYPAGAEHDPRAPWNQPSDCDACDGLGYVGDKDNENETDCPECGGTGREKTAADKRREWEEDKADMERDDE